MLLSSPASTRSKFSRRTRLQINLPRPLFSLLPSPLKFFLFIAARPPRFLSCLLNRFALNAHRELTTSLTLSHAPPFVRILSPMQAPFRVLVTPSRPVYSFLTIVRVTFPLLQTCLLYGAYDASFPFPSDDEKFVFARDLQFESWVFVLFLFWDFSFLRIDT